MGRAWKRATISEENGNRETIKISILIPEDYFPLEENDDGHFGVVAQGNFANTLVGSCKKDGQRIEVSIKRYKLDKLKETTHGMARLRREVDLFRHLDHPNIVRLIETFEEFDEIRMNWKALYIVAEKMDHTLEDYFRHLSVNDHTDDPTLRDIRHMGSFLSQILRGIDYLHQRGIMHRDITPRSIGMNQQEFEIKILDFGLARETNPELDHSTNVDTPYIYQPLEVLMRSRYNTDVDIWAAALVAVEMLGMKLFMPTGNDQEVKRKIRRRGAENAVKDRIFEVLGVPNDQYSSIFGRLVDAKPSPNRLNNFLPSDRIGKDVGPLKVVDFLDLIRQMLDPNPATRAKANDCLKHPFLSALPINKRYDTEKTTKEQNKKDRDALLINGIGIFEKASSSNRLNLPVLDPLELFND